jgi:hypothetical protein
MTKEQSSNEQVQKFSGVELQSFYKNNLNRKVSNFANVWFFMYSSVFVGMVSDGLYFACLGGIAYNLFRGMERPNGSSEIYKKFIEEQIVNQKRVATLGEYHEIAKQQCQEVFPAYPTDCVQNFKTYLAAARMGAPGEIKSAFDSYIR